MNLVDIRTTIAVTASAALAAAATAAAPAAQAREVAVPWFAPIAAYYHHNPRITPQTNFAQLEFGIHTGRPRAHRH